MKDYLFALMLCLGTMHVADAQQVSLSELISIRSGDLDKANQILLPRGWVFKGRQPHVVPATEENCLYDVLTWDNQSILSSSYITVKIGKNCGNYVSLQTIEVQTFYAIRAEIEKYSMKLLNTEVTEDKDGSTWTISVFTGAKYEVDMAIWTSPNKASNQYNVNLYLK
ncbi:hypothetical protein [Hymenobacter psoromatis]|uniref:hypothetical protein n=1 Tax=Hymenobacter psoromatis TaxID=1484116 RepID=UPI001CBDE51C|nr:hypothetical protein [Hymenobacter psoromatis]